MRQHCQCGKKDHSVEAVWASGFCWLKQNIAKDCKNAVCSWNASVSGDVMYRQHPESQTLLEMPITETMRAVDFDSCASQQTRRQPKPHVLLWGCGWKFFFFFFYILSQLLIALVSKWKKYLSLKFPEKILSGKTLYFAGVSHSRRWAAERAGPTRLWLFLLSDGCLVAGSRPTLLSAAVRSVLRSHRAEEQVHRQFQSHQVDQSSSAAAEQELCECCVCETSCSPRSASGWRRRPLSPLLCFLPSERAAAWGRTLWGPQQGAEGAAAAVYGV